MGNWLLISEVNRSFVWSAIRGLFGLLDRVVFWLFGKVMQLMYDIAGILNTSTNGELPAFYTVYTKINERLYFILTVYMLFKITISLLQYLVNPDTITDKERGASKLVSRIIISMVMLIGFPFVRDELMNLQSDIIQDQTIQKIVTGKKDDSYNAERRGNAISASIYNGSFFKPDSGGEFVTCATPEELDGPTILSCDSELKNADGQLMPSLSDMINKINEPATDNDNKYKFNYMPLIGTVVGAVMVLLVLGMCIDIATRTFKLVILFAIAPIPILSYIDPKASKDGAFSKWTKMLITTWLELFIRMAIISFIFLVISEINSNFSTGGSIFVRLALTIALLFFAKDAPKFICDALGIKMPDGGGVFGGVGKVLAAGALGLGAIGTGIANARNNIDSTKGLSGMDKVKAIGGNIGKSLFYGGTAGIGSLLAGGWAGANAKDHQLKAVMEARNKHLANTMAGNTALYRGRKAASNLLLGADDGAAMKKKISSYSSAFNAYKDFKTTAEDKMADSSSFRRSVSFKVGNGPNDDRNMADVNFKQIVRNLELAKNGDTTAANWFTNFGTTAEEVDLHLNDIKDQFTSAYMAEAYAGGADATTRGKMEYALDAAGDMEYNLDLSSADGALGSVKGAMGDASDKEREIKTSDAYKRLSGQ